MDPCSQNGATYIWNVLLVHLTLEYYQLLFQLIYMHVSQMCPVTLWNVSNSWTI